MMARYNVSALIAAFLAVFLTLGCNRDFENKASNRSARAGAPPATARKPIIRTSPSASASGTAGIQIPAPNASASSVSLGQSSGAKERETAGGPGTKSLTPPAEEKKLAVPVSAQQCLTCHQHENYRPFETATPFLAGQTAEYILFQLNQYRFKQRDDTSGKMKNIADQLGPKVLEANEIAEFFAKIKPQPAKEALISYRDTYLAKRGERLARDRCTSCHMNAEDGNGPSDPLVPRLAGQSKQYLINQLIEYKMEAEVKPRRNKLMSSLASQLTEDDVEAISAFFALQK